MTDKELSGRARLKEALKLSDQTYIDKHPPIDQKVQYSQNYLKRVERLTKQKKSPYFGYFKLIGARVAIISAVFLIIFSCVMSVEAVRAPVSQFIETVSITIYSEFIAQEPVHTEHDFSVLATDDPNKHYYRCTDKRCKEKYGEEFHTYVVNEEKRRLECSVCGRVAK